MTLYSFALFVHVVAVLGLFTAITLEIAALWRMRAATSVAMVREWSGVVERMAAVFQVVSLLIVLTGVYMVARKWNWQTAWADISLVGLIALVALEAVVNARRGKAIHSSAREAPEGGVPGGLTRRINDPMLWTSVQTMMFAALGMVYLMTVKPGVVGSLVAMAVAFGLGLASVQPILRRPPAGRSAPGSARNRALPPDS